jgi:ethanolamine utilization protein EutS
MDIYGKQRIIQETVPGKQITLAHIIAKPAPGLYTALGPAGPCPPGAIGIFTVTPGEAALILADIAVKTAAVAPAAVDRVSGTLLITGDVAAVAAAAEALLLYADQQLGFTTCPLTKT